MGLTLDPVTATDLSRTTVHQQYNQKAFGLFLFGRLVPIVVTVRRPGNVYEKSVIMFGPVSHKYSPYKDLGFQNICCQQAFLFNIRHYVKCYLPGSVEGSESGPFTFNLCQKCGASVIDDCGRLISMLKSRKYRRNAFIWKASKVLQDQAGQDEIFTYQRGVTGNGC